MAISISQERDQVSTEQRRNAMKYLTDTRDTVKQHVKNLTDEQWAFKPSAEQWSIQDVLEHLILFESYTHFVINSMKDIPLDESDHDPLAVEQFLLGAIPDRSKKLQAPAPGYPTGRWKSTETLEQFLIARVGTQQLLEENLYLRGRLVSNPLYPSLDWDGYSWIVAVGLHTA